MSHRESEENTMTETTNMYPEEKTRNAPSGCEFNCTYCVPSFQRQSKRQKNRCADCYTYTSHCHEDRLDKIPSAKIIFVCGNGDISFCPPDFTRQMVERIVEHNKRAPHKTYYLQSKEPAYFEPFLSELPDNVILLTTLETNRDAGYEAISKAPPPSVRYQQFKALDYPRKGVTIEPLLTSTCVHLPPGFATSALGTSTLGSTAGRNKYRWRSYRKTRCGS
jgi:hypothetical protein